MMHSTKRFLAAMLTTLVVLATPLLVRAEVYEIDPVHSHVGFIIRHFMSKVRGEFGKFSGAIDFNKDKPGNSKVSATIDAVSINTNNEKRDSHLRSADFFDATKFPTLTFESSKVVVKKGKEEGTMGGTLTMHGVSKPVALQVTYLGEAKDPWGGTRVSFEATTKINRKDFGLIWNKVLDSGSVMLGDDVTIEIEIEAVLKK